MTVWTSLPWLIKVSTGLVVALAASLCSHALADTPIAAPAYQLATMGDDWQSLSPQHQATLAPLAGQWATLDDSSRQKWIRVANRYPRLSPDAQVKIRERMTHWAKVPAQQRGEARLRFQNSRQLSPQERQEKWAAYQALSPQERHDLTKQALRKQRPVVMAASEAGPRELTQLRDVRPSSSLQNRKTNLVPGSTAAAPRAVSPTVVKTGPGATTSLVTQTAAPPLHQHTGLPKISAGATFVDPQTMLPRKGSQSAAMTPVSQPPASPDTP